MQTLEADLVEYVQRATTVVLEKKIDPEHDKWREDLFRDFLTDPARILQLAKTRPQDPDNRDKLLDRAIELRDEYYSEIKPQVEEQLDFAKAAACLRESRRLHWTAYLAEKVIAVAIEQNREDRMQKLLLEVLPLPGKLT